MTKLTTIDFHGAKLVAIGGDTPESVRVAMKPIVEGMGLDWEAQRKKLSAHPVLKVCTSVMEAQMPGDDQARQVTLLPLNRIHFWLATIHPDRLKDPAVRERVILYQTEAADVLFNHFFGKVIEHPAGALDAKTVGGVVKAVVGKLTADQNAAIARVLEILEARGAGIPVEAPKGTTLVRQHARRVSVEREKALHLSTLIERLERVLVSDAPPMIPPPDMDRHMIYRAGIALVLVDAADWRLGRGEKAFVLHDGRMTAAIMHGVGNQDGSLWSKDRTGWALVHEFPAGIAEPSLCQVKVLGRLIKTVADPNYGRAA